MNNSEILKQEKNILRWGGVAGIISGSLFIFVMIFVAVVIGDDPAELTDRVARFPSIHLLRVIENGVYLLGLLFAVALFLALPWALRKESFAPAFFGSAIGIVGLTSMIMSSTPHVAHSPLADLFFAQGTTPQTQETLGLMWEATWGLFDAPLYVGLFVVPIGIALIGVAILKSSSFGKGLGWMSLIIGLVAFLSAILQMIDPASDVGAFSYLIPIIFYFSVGMKVYRLSIE